MKKRNLLLLVISTIVFVSFSSTRASVIVSQVGDIDNFHGGDAADVPFRSTNVWDYFSALGIDTPKDLDVMSQNDGGSLAYSHSFTLPPSHVITSATLTIGAYWWGGGMSDFVRLDRGISADPIVGSDSPRILISDVLGYVPPPYVTTEIVIDLSIVPIRPFEGGIPENHNLLGELVDGELNIVLADDSGVDYSILQIETVPEPTTLSLFALGALALLRRRKA